MTKDEILPFLTTWTGLQGLTLCEMLEKDRYYMTEKQNK